MQRATMREVVNLSMIKAVSDALLKNGDLVARIAIFVLNFAERMSNCVEKKDYLVGSRRKIRELLPSPPTLIPPNDNYIPLKEKNNSRVRRDRKIKIESSLSTRSLHKDAKSVTSSGKFVKVGDLTNRIRRFNQAQKKGKSIGLFVSRTCG